MQRRVDRYALQTRRSRVGARYEFGEITKGQYEARIAELDTQIEKLGREAATFRPPAPFFWKLRSRLLESQGLGLAGPASQRGDADGLQDALHSMFEAIYIDLRTTRRGPDTDRFVTPSLIVGVTPQPGFGHFFAEGTRGILTFGPSSGRGCV